MQTSNIAKWIDELQSAIENLKKKIDKAYKAVDGLPTFDVSDPEDGQLLIYDGSDGAWKNYGFEPGGYTKTLIYDTPITGAGQVTTNADVTGFDIIEICYEAKSASSGASMAIWIDAQMLADCPYATSSSNKHVYIYISSSEFGRMTMGEDTDQINFFDNATIKISSIYGLKF